MSLSSIPKLLRQQIFERDQGRCAFCRLAQTGQGTLFHINHVIPRSTGGPTVVDNLVLQCPYCSLHKSNTIRALDGVENEEVSLFHPLQQRWHEHFVMLDDASLRGRTAVGRVTVVTLHMNDPIPRTARALQIMLGLL